MNNSLAISLVLVCILIGSSPLAVSAAGPADSILQQAGVRGGVIVHVGCGDGVLTASLRAGDGFLVHGLDTTAANVAAARSHIRELGLYGQVSVDTFDGRTLPYVDNFVNLVVADDLGQVPMNEVMRVLAPGGVAVTLDPDTRNPKPDTLFRKPCPPEIDDWTHYLHDAQGSCVGQDTVVGPPHRLQWVGGPRHARSHEHTASVHAVVSADGRTFDVTDLGSRASIQLPSKYTLTARDAFNGTILWRREIPDWFNHLYPLKSGPAYMPRRLVAVGSVVYVSGGVGHPLLALDAATGKVLHEYPGTTTTVELVVSEGVIFAVVDPDRKLFDYDQQNDNCWKERDRASSLWAWTSEKDQLKAIDAQTGRLLWKAAVPVAPMTLAADDRKVCFFDGQSVVALDRQTGQSLWASDSIAIGQAARKSKRRSKPDDAPVATGSTAFKTGYGPKLILADQHVLFSPFGRIVALDGATGKTVWDVKKAERSGHFSPEDLFVIDGMVWAAGTARGRGSTFGGYDLATGEQTKNYPNPIEAFYMHQRCYPGRATTKWLIPAATGTEFVDPKTGEWQIHHWVRGGCIYGMMPANGLLYATPQACACYYQSKLNGFTALASGRRKLPATPTDRLQKGPAYDQIGNRKSQIANPADWPTFRGDNRRSGCARTALPANLKQAWQAEFGGRISQTTVAGGKVFVCAIDQHTIHALDAKTGGTAWTYTAGGRVDSPPTIYKGLAIFGCADGHVYAVAASDGRLAWRFRAAPVDQRLLSYGQLESVWPVHGSTLIENDVLYCVAGRSVFLDGGLRMIRLNPVTGELIGENIMDDNVPGTDQNLQSAMAGKHMPVALPDILSSDGSYVYMKSQTFDMDGRRIRIEPQAPNTQQGSEQHLFAPISFLDDSWFHRAYWVYGRAAGEGWGEWQVPGKYAPYGRILCFNDDNVFGYGRDPEYLCNSSVLEYRLYSAAKQAQEGKAVGSSVTWKSLAEQPEEKLTRLAFHWKVAHPPLLVRAMALANDTLFVAGPPDLVDEREMWGRSNEPVFQQKMREQAEALEGSRGGVLWAVSTETGEKLDECKLDDLPTFDGMTAAAGRLFMATANHKLLCFE
ncbi:MAG: PQQ-binding-like beta-propeller repeat protein [Planctomycetes bacterium]|nr:PQQ-binding-like beta-propeller repeat protein [Planctomycetota bacterium]MBL7040578.1 PQQ-binding-like beta-propeller repeat protein [Pirellulaceae bacterium]